MAGLHPLQLDALPLLPADRTVHLLTRHSVREEAQNGFADYRLQLTEEGVRLARDYGALLPRRVSRYFSSPVARCLDTAAALQEGQSLHDAGEPPPVIKTGVLMEPGCYVTDIKAAGPCFLRHGALSFINLHLQAAVPGVLHPDAGRRKLADHLRLAEQGVAADSLVVHVTHDTILAAFIAGLAGHRIITQEDWPWMMEGVWVWFEQTRLVWVWRGKRSFHDITDDRGTSS